MPEHRDTSIYESGRATAPPGVCYTSLSSSTSEDYIQTVASTPGLTNLTDPSCTALVQSPLFTSNFSNFAQLQTQASPHYTSDYSPCSSPNPGFNYSSTISKNNSLNLPLQSPQYTPSYSSSSQVYPTPISSTSDFPSCTNSSINTTGSNSSKNNNSYNSDNNNCKNSTNSNYTINNSNNNSSSNNNSNYSSSSNINNIKSSFDFAALSENSSKSQQSLCLTSENINFPFSDQTSSLFNYTKFPKLNTSSVPKYSSNNSGFSYFSTNQPKNTQNKDIVDVSLEKNSETRKNSDSIQKLVKNLKDESDCNFNFGELQQFLSKHNSKIKSTLETNQDSVTDSFLRFLQKKNQERNFQDNCSYDLNDISQILVSFTCKYKSEEKSSLKKKDNCEESKLMNDFLTKVLSDKEEKKVKSFDDKKKSFRKEVFNDLSSELNDKKSKRDAMSHYQEDKSHHKRQSSYGDFNQWDYLSQQEIHNSSNHSRRGQFSFGGSSQSHSMGWNPMGMAMPRQTNPYYSNPHGHVIPAHAHADYRYNQWNNPNHKNVPNIHNAHSQNTILPQAKHLADIQNSVQDFGLPVGPSSDLSKLRTSPLIRTPPPEKSGRPGIHTDHLGSINPALRNPPPTAHPKTVVNNPLTDLQILVTNQESEGLPQKLENYQQETVDLSAHSEVSKVKENSVKEGDRGKDSCEVKEKSEHKSPVNIVSTQNKERDNDSNFSENEKPVELTSKSVEKNVDTEISSSISVNNVDNKLLSSDETFVRNKESESQKGAVEEITTSEESVKTSVIVEKEGSTSIDNSKANEGIPNNVESTLEDLDKKPELSEEKTVRKNEDAPLEDLKQTASTTENETQSKNNAHESEKSISVDAEPKEDVSPENATNKRKAEDEGEIERKKPFLEVESRLEKMFEGIGEENSDLPTVTSTSAEVKPATGGTVKKSPKKKPSRKSRNFRLSSGQSSSSESHFASKKFKSIASKDESRKKIKKTLCEVMERRGPFLHVEGSKESPSSVVVINFPKGDDEDEKDKSFAKKQSSNVSRTKHHNELDYRRRSRNGLFSSTLSARYDAHTTDHTWVCVFCKKGPHYNTLGDLFGPYIISADENTSLCDFSGDEKDISDAQKRGGRNKKSLRSNNMVEHFQKMSRKLRRTQSCDSSLTGMTVISDDQIDQLRYEVWVHEQCAIWSPNVCLIGSRILGMQEAIWSSVKMMCSKCGAFGANIGCVYRNCPNRSHYHCAKESGWSLKQGTFISTCHVHKPRS